MLWIFAGWDEAFYLVMRGFKKIFTSNQEFITAKCVKLKSCWCFPRELSGIHKTRIDLGLAVTFNLNIDCACIYSQLFVGFLLLSYSQIRHFGLLVGGFLPVSYLCSGGSCSSFDSAVGTAVDLPLDGELDLKPIFSQRLWCAELKTSESVL